MKIGRNEFDINENDLILDNSACYQLITREIGKGWHRYPPIISKTQFNKLVKLGAIYTNDYLRNRAEIKYGHKGLTYWKFNIEKLHELE